MNLWEITEELPTGRPCVHPGPSQGPSQRPHFPTFAALCPLPPSDLGWALPQVARTHPQTQLPPGQRPLSRVLCARCCWWDPVDPVQLEGGPAATALSDARSVFSRCTDTRASGRREETEGEGLFLKTQQKCSFYNLIPTVLFKSRRAAFESVAAHPQPVGSPVPRPLRRGPSGSQARPQPGSAHLPRGACLPPDGAPYLSNSPTPTRVDGAGHVRAGVFKQNGP